VSGFIKNIGHKLKAVFNAIEEGYYDE